MSKKEAPLNALESFMPQGSFQLIEPYLLNYKVHLTITRSRKTILGDYRNAVAGKTHRITVNGNLNKYAFLITLLHELAHLITFIRFGNKVASHGKEWKSQFSDLLAHFVQAQLFPDDIKMQLQKSMSSPAASSCADTALMRVLRKYDVQKEGFCLVEELAEGEHFRISGGRIFKRLHQQRKRIQAMEIATKKVYLFSPVYEVEKIIS